MNPQFQNMVVASAAQQKKKKGSSKGDGGPNKFSRAKSRYRFKKSVIQNTRSTAFILIGILSAGFGLETFILPGDLIDGGATGISLLIAEITGKSLSIIILLVNIPFILIGYKQMGQSFAIKTALAIVGLAVCLALFPYPHFEPLDKILVSIFGGFFLGAGIGFAMRGGAVLDGTEVMAIYVSRKTSASIGDVIMVFNVVIFSVAAYLLTIPTALYSMLAYLAASKTVDFLIEGIEEYTGVTIISAKNTEISTMIVEKLGRGITVYSGKGGYGKTGYTANNNMNIIFTVITRLEISRLQSEIDLIDPGAFVVMHSIKDTRGGMIKKRPMAH